MARIAAVFGATGLQGGSVVRALLKDGVFTPRAVTRSTSSDSALKLAALGAEIVKGDLADYASVRSAVAGAEVVFAVSIPSFFGGISGSELEQGRRMVDAAKEAGVKYFVWSSLPSISALSGGRYQIPHHDDKAAVDDYLRASGLPHSILQTASFLENWTRPDYPDYATLDAHGAVAFKSRFLRGTQMVLSWIDHDMGPSVSALFNAYARGCIGEVNGKPYLVGCAALSVEEWHGIIEKTLGRKLNVTWLDTLDFKLLDDMYDSVREFPWYAGRQVPDPGLVALGVKFGTPEEFVRAVLKPQLGL